MESIMVRADCDMAQGLLFFVYYSTLFNYFVHTLALPIVLPPPPPHPHPPLSRLSRPVGVLEATGAFLSIL